MKGEELLITLIMGGIAGWLGGQIYKGSGLGLIGNIVVGILGSFIGYWAFGKLGISLGSGWISYILTSAAGAVALLAVLNIVLRNR